MEVTTLSVPSLMSSLSETLYQFQQQRYLCDVLIFTSDGYIPAHRVILVAASKHFREIESSRNIHTTPEANFYLTKEKSEDMQKIVELIYTGVLNISTENTKRIHNLCHTLGLDDAITELEFFISRKSDTDNIDKNLNSRNDENHLSLKQLETEVISHLEKSRSNNAFTHTINDNSETQTSVYNQHTSVEVDTADVGEVEKDVTSTEQKHEKKTKLKSPNSKNKKCENNNENNLGEAIPTEKFINCALCKEKFQDKKQLMEHRRAKHCNKRKPMHTKRYVPIASSEANETLSDNEDRENFQENLSNDDLEYQEEECVFSTRQGTKRRSAEHLTKLKKTTQFVCRLCKDEFPNNELLQEHRKLIHPGGKRENLTCQLCDKVLSTWLNLIEHKYKKHNIGYDVEKYKVHMCNMPNCDFSTIVEYKLKTHYSDVHGEVGSYICEICNKGCKSAPQLKYHMKTVHADDKTPMLYKCDECGKTFRHSCNLKKHVDYVHLKIGDKKYLCHLCTYKCMSKTDLNNHLLKIHDIPLPKSCKVYKCDKCDYFTLTRSCYERHIQLHQGEDLQKSYMCSTCGKGFYNIQNVKAHEKRHKSEIMCCPFEGCGYSTKFKHTMKNHIAGMHTHKNVRPYQCHLCEYSCKLKGNLDKHLRGKHGVEVMTIPKLRQKAIETGKGFSEIVFPPRNCNELPAKLADKHQLQTTQKSQDFQDVSFPQLLEMAKQASRTVSQSERSPDSQLIDIQLSDQQTTHKDGDLSYQTPQNSTVITEIHQYHESLSPSTVSMETDGPSYSQEQEVALSNLNPVPVNSLKQSPVKDPTYSQSGDLPTSYSEQSMMYLHENTDHIFSSRPLPAHMSQPHSAESYAAMLSSYLTSKNSSQIPPHQTLPSLLPLNMQNYQTTGQPNPTLLNHLLTQMEDAGFSTLARPTSVPAEETVTYQSQLRPHSVHSMDNLSYRNSTYQGQGHYESNLSPEESYQQETRYSTPVVHQSPTNQREAYNKDPPYSSEIIIARTTDESDSRSNQTKSSESLASKTTDIRIETSPRNQEDYSEIAQLAYSHT